MMGHPNQYPRIETKQLLPFTADRALYRAFDRVIAAKNGSVLLVPLYLVHGDLSALVDGCPVPWDEVDDVLRMEWGATHDFDFDSEPYSERVMGLAGLARDGWSLDFMRLRGSPTLVWRLAHRSGVRFACTADLVYAAGENDADGCEPPFDRLRANGPD